MGAQGVGLTCRNAEVRCDTQPAVRRRCVAAADGTAGLGQYALIHLLGEPTDARIARRQRACALDVEACVVTRRFSDGAALQPILGQAQVLADALFELTAFQRAGGVGRSGQRGTLTFLAQLCLEKRDPDVFRHQRSRRFERRRRSVETIGEDRLFRQGQQRVDDAVQPRNGARLTGNLGDDLSVQIGCAFACGRHNVALRKGAVCRCQQRRKFR